MVVTSLFM